jgi:hypothetical protein
MTENLKTILDEVQNEIKEFADKCNTFIMDENPFGPLYGAGYIAACRHCAKKLYAILEKLK